MSHHLSMDADLISPKSGGSPSGKDVLFVVGRTMTLVFALRSLLRARRDGSDKLKMLDGLFLLAGAVTSLLIGIRKIRKKDDE